MEQGNMPTKGCPSRSSCGAKREERAGDGL